GRLLLLNVISLLKRGHSRKYIEALGETTEGITSDDFEIDDDGQTRIEGIIDAKYPYEETSGEEPSMPEELKRLLGILDELELEQIRARPKISASFTY
ncbi:MAG: hypothetical protein AABW89_06190, partial [Nanoarchaeota archaeon]